MLKRSSAQSREPLSREKIEVTALTLIEEVGLEAFSTRKLGQSLGCEAMSIYHHFPSKAHLLDALVDRVIAHMHAPSPELSPELSPAQRLLALAHSWRNTARSLPKFYLYLSIHRWNSETGIRFLNEILRCFHDAGLSQEQAARGFRVLAYFIMGATLDEISGYANGPSSLEPMSLDELQRQYPLVAQAGEYFSPNQFDKTFDLGLHALLQQLGILKPP
jgi:AcrR family transcriptional regulator